MKYEVGRPMLQTKSETLINLFKIHVWDWDNQSYCEVVSKSPGIPDIRFLIITSHDFQNCLVTQSELMSIVRMNIQ